MTFDDDEKDTLGLIVYKATTEALKDHVIEYHKNGNGKGIGGFFRDYRDIVLFGIVVVGGIVFGILSYTGGL